jgi:hypothetical protein
MAGWQSIIDGYYNERAGEQLFGDSTDEGILVDHHVQLKAAVLRG